MGYAGGTTPDPTYRNIGDHAETLQVDYDPALTTYEELLDAFWCGHSPIPGIGQYRSIIFYHNEAQKTAAMESVTREETLSGNQGLTAIVPSADFYLAEDYHQKYYLRGNSTLFRDISHVYPDLTGLLNSTAAARLNGYIAGFGDEATVQAQLDEYGLSAEGREELLKIIERGLELVCN